MNGTAGDVWRTGGVHGLSSLSACTLTSSSGAKSPHTAHNGWPDMKSCKHQGVSAHKAVFPNSWGYPIKPTTEWRKLSKYESGSKPQKFITISMNKCFCFQGSSEVTCAAGRGRIRLQILELLQDPLRSWFACNQPPNRSDHSENTKKNNPIPRTNKK